MAKTKTLTEGTPWKVILAFAVPIMIGQVFQLFYSLVDTKVVGAILGELALASVGSVSTLYNFLTGFCNGLTLGFSVLISMSFGAKDEKKLKRYYAASWILSIVTVAVIILIVMLFLHPIMGIMNIPEENMEMARSYVRVLIVGLLITNFYNMFANSLRAIGDSVTPLIFLIVSSLGNVGLDYLFVAGFHMGVAGAAWATVLAQAISVVLCYIRVKRKFPILHVKKSDFRMTKDQVAEMYKSGISLGLMNSLVGFGTLSLQTSINNLGNDIIVAHTAARKIDEIVMTPGIVIGIAMATFSGQNYGAKRMDRIREGLKSTLIMAIICDGAIFVLVLVAAKAMIRFIASTSNPTVLYWGSIYLKLDMAFMVICFMIIVLRNTMAGFGDRITPVVSSFIELAGKVVFAFLFVPLFGYWGVIWAEPVVWIAMILPLIIVTWKRVFKKVQVERK